MKLIKEGMEGIVLSGDIEGDDYFEVAVEDTITLNPKSTYIIDKGCVRDISDKVFKSRKFDTKEKATGIVIIGFVEDLPEVK